MHEPMLLKREKSHKRKTAVSHQLEVNLLLGAGFFSSKTRQIHLTFASFDKKKDTQLACQTGMAIKDQIFLEIFQCPLHYANVAEISILKCPTLTNYFSVVFHPGCPKFWG